MTREPTAIGARALIRELGDCFEQRGWNDQDRLALAIADAARLVGSLDADSAADLAKSTFLGSNGIDRSELREAVASVFEGRVLLPPALDYPAQATSVTNTINISGDNNDLSGQVNMGSLILNLSVESPKGEVLEGVSRLIRQGLEADLSVPELAHLAQVVANRNDLGQVELETVARAAIKEAGPAPSKLTQFRNAVGTNVASGVLVQAILAAATALT